jgi:spore germination cell wall hydrolase CwlJ-like protein
MRKIIVALLLMMSCSQLSIPPRLEYKPPEPWRCMAWVVHDEARGESLKGARAVLDVVLRRMKKTGKSACDVVSAPRQFSGYSERKVYNVTLTNKEALQRFIQVAKMKPVAVQCTHFHATYVRPAWATKMTRCVRIGKHIFFKEKHK